VRKGREETFKDDTGPIAIHDGDDDVTSRWNCALFACMLCLAIIAGAILFTAEGNPKFISNDVSFRWYLLKMRERSPDGYVNSCPNDCLHCGNTTITR
jgi:hypothetical protein